VADFFNEVDEDVRAGEWRVRIRLALPWIIGAVIAIVVATGGWWAWTAWAQHQSAAASEAYDRGLKALQSQNQAGAEAAFAETVKESGGGAYKSLALAQQAGILVDQHRTADAVKKFDEAAKAAPSPIMGDMDSIKAAWLLVDTAPFAEIEKRMTPLMAKDRPYRSYAREVLAMAKLLVPSKVKDARGDFELLSVASDVGDDVRTRAKAAIALIDSGQTGQLADILKEAQRAPAPGAGGFNPFAAGPGQPQPQAQAGAPQQ
jgi:hypothetical protein